MSLSAHNLLCTMLKVSILNDLCLRRLLKGNPISCCQLMSKTNNAFEAHALVNHTMHVGCRAGQGSTVAIRRV